MIIDLNDELDFPSEYGGWEYEVPLQNRKMLVGTNPFGVSEWKSTLFLVIILFFIFIEMEREIRPNFGPLISTFHCLLREKWTIELSYPLYFSRKNVSQ